MSAMISDIRTNKIKNYIIAAGVSTGAAFQVFQYGIPGLVECCIAVILPAIVLFPLFLTKVLGAGDIKLYCAIGAFVGLQGIFAIILISFILSVFQSLFQESLLLSIQSSISYVIQFIIQLIQGKILYPYQYDSDNDRFHRVHLSISIGISTIFYFILQGGR